MKRVTRAVLTGIALLAAMLAAPLMAQTGTGGGPGGGGGSGTVNSGTAGQLGYYAGAGTTISGTNALPSGTTATTTPVTADATTLVSTNQFVQSAIDLSMATTPLSITGGTYSFDSQCTGTEANLTASGGAITNILVWIPIGSGCAAGDVITPAGGNTDAMIQITTVNGSGQPTAGTILYGGTGYSSGTAIVHTPAYSFPFTFVLTGVLSSNATFIMTHGTYLTQSNQWIFANNTTGAFTVTVCVAGATDACAAGGRTATIPQGTNNTHEVIVQTDGELNVDLAAIVNAADLIGTLPYTAVTPPGTNLQVIYNNSGAWGTSASLTYNQALEFFCVGGLCNQLAPGNYFSLQDNEWNTTLQLNVENMNTGNNASGDLVVTFNDGTNTLGYVDLGGNNSGYMQPAYNAGLGNDGYLIVYGPTSGTGQPEHGNGAAEHGAQCWSRRNKLAADYWAVDKPWQHRPGADTTEPATDYWSHALTDFSDTGNGNQRRH